MKTFVQNNAKWFWNEFGMTADSCRILMESDLTKIFVSNNVKSFGINSELCKIMRSENGFKCNENSVHNYIWNNSECSLEPQCSVGSQLFEIHISIHFRLNGIVLDYNFLIHTSRRELNCLHLWSCLIALNEIIFI